MPSFCPFLRLLCLLFCSDIPIANFTISIVGYCFLFSIIFWRRRKGSRLFWFLQTCFWGGCSSHFNIGCLLCEFPAGGSTVSIPTFSTLYFHRHNLSIQNIIPFAYLTVFLLYLYPSHVCYFLCLVYVTFRHYPSFKSDTFPLVVLSNPSASCVLGKNSPHCARPRLHT